VKTKALASLYGTFGALCFYKAKESREMSTSTRNWNEFLKFVGDVFTGKSPEIKLSGIDIMYSVPIKVTREGTNRISIDRGNFTNVCAECFGRGENSMNDEWLDAYKSGNIKTEEDAVRLVEHMHGLWSEARDRILELEARNIPKKKLRGEKTKHISQRQLEEALCEGKSLRKAGKILDVDGDTVKSLAGRFRIDLESYGIRVRNK
jgi:hypothetical protein